MYILQASYRDLNHLSKHYKIVQLKNTINSSCSKSIGEYACDLNVRVYRIFLLYHYDGFKLHLFMGLPALESKPQITMILWLKFLHRFFTLFSFLCNIYTDPYPNPTRSGIHFTIPVNRVIRVIQ